MVTLVRANHHVFDRFVRGIGVDGVDLRPNQVFVHGTSSLGEANAARAIQERNGHGAIDVDARVQL
jgi:hypothetical protein